MLQDMGLIEEAKSEGTRKAFAATEEGKAHLEEKAEEVDGLFVRLEGAGRATARPTPRRWRALGRATCSPPSGIA